jgi:mRNA-degrading endonuclease RelE of RelBE toxin-antitoxin system
MMAHEIEYSREALAQLGALSKRNQQIVLDTVDRQLKDQPTVVTRNRKKLRPNLLAEWELRVGAFRVYYVVRKPPPLVVAIVAVGRKVGSRVFVGNEDVTP